MVAVFVNYQVGISGSISSEKKKINPIDNSLSYVQKLTID